MCKKQFIHIIYLFQRFVSWGLACEVLMDEQLNSKSFKLQLAAVQIASLGLCLGWGAGGLVDKVRS